LLCCEEHDNDKDFCSHAHILWRQPHKKKEKKRGVGTSPIVARQPCKVMVGNEIYLLAPLKKRKIELKLLHCYMVRSKVMVGSFALMCHLF